MPDTITLAEIDELLAELDAQKRKIVADAQAAITELEAGEAAIQILRAKILHKQHVYQLGQEIQQAKHSSKSP